MPFLIQWHDLGREPQCESDPAYPLGVDVDTSEGATRTCKAAVPYPAVRCGYYVIECLDCHATVGCTTAGRPDDPRTVKVACKGMTQ